MRARWAAIHASLSHIRLAFQSRAPGRQQTGGATRKGGSAPPGGWSNVRATYAPPVLRPASQLEMSGPPGSYAGGVSRAANAARQIASGAVSAERWNAS